MRAFTLSFKPFATAPAILAPECIMLYKRCSPSADQPGVNMAHLDFREALSTPEEKIFSPASTVAALEINNARVPSLTDLLRELRLSGSTWANIVFVAIAAVGGMVCAFYFFNGVELVRAAASWPSEYLYPRPTFTDQRTTAELPNPADHFSTSSSGADSGKSDDARKVAESNAAPTAFTPFEGTTGSTTPPVVTEPPPIVTIVPPIVPPPPTPVVDQLTGDANTVVNSGGTLVQSLAQDPVGTSLNTVAATTTTLKKTTKKVTTSSRRKISSSQQNLANTIPSRTTLQQTTANQTQIGANSVRPVNQIMTGGGLGGGGSIGAIGGGAGAAAGGGAGTGTGAGGGIGAGPVGGAGGLGGLNGAGLGGTLSGVGGTVGGVIGSHH